MSGQGQYGVSSVRSAVSVSFSVLPPVCFRDCRALSAYVLCCGFFSACCSSKAIIWRVIPFCPVITGNVGMLYPLIRAITALAASLSAALPGCLVLCTLLCGNTVYASADKSSASVLPPVSSPDGFTTLRLNRADHRYAVASVQHSSGFIPVMPGEQLENAPVEPADSEYGVMPDFREHPRYWLYAQVHNDTDVADWVLHISNFGFSDLRVLIRNPAAPDEARVEIFNTAGGNNADINTIGRALPLALTLGDTYQLVVELSGPSFVWTPYIALMSKGEYHLWSQQMDFAFKPAIGMIIGIAMLGIVCWLLMAEWTFFWASLSSLLMLVFYLEHSALPEIFWRYSYEKGDLFWLLLSSTLLAHLIFAAKFLRVSQQTGFLYRTFLFTGITTVVFQAVVLFVPLHEKLLLMAANYTMVWVVIIGSGIAKVRSDGQYYVLYLLGWMPLVLSVLQAVVYYILPRKTNLEVHASYKMIYVLYIQIVHMLIHAMALVLRVRAMRREKEQAVLQNQAKSRFIAQSSHDLNQPLHSMRLFLESLKPYLKGNEASALYEGLCKTHRQMSDSFAAIMDVSKLEAGELQFNKQRVYLSSVFSRLQNEFLIQANTKNIKLNFHTCNLAVYTDPLLLERMLRNLISNAIKFTDQGRVVIGCRRRHDEVVVQIIDTGCGIAAEEQAHIFDMYKRLDEHQRQVDGAGIGLSVVKHLSVLLNHPLSIRSENGRGCVFSLSLPLAESAVDASQAAGISTDSPRVALFGCDQAVADYVSKWGCRVTRLQDLSASVLSAAETPDLLIADFQALNHWLAGGHNIAGLQRISVLACTADQQQGQELQRSTGLDWQLLNTPLLPTQLRALVNHVARRKIQPANYDDMLPPAEMSNG